MFVGPLLKTNWVKAPSSDTFGFPSRNLASSGVSLADLRSCSRVLSMHNPRYWQRGQLQRFLPAQRHLTAAKHTDILDQVRFLLSLTSLLFAAWTVISSRMSLERFKFSSQRLCVHASVYNTYAVGLCFNLCCSPAHWMRQRPKRLSCSALSRALLVCTFLHRISQPLVQAKFCM